MTGSIQVSKGYLYCVLNFRDENGHAKPKWFSTGLPEKGNRKKAKEILQKLLVKYSTAVVTTRYADLPFDKYCELWLEHKKASLAATTYYGYENKMKHIIYYFRDKNITLRKVTPRDIQEFYNYLLEAGNLFKYKKSNGLSQRTIQDIAKLLRGVFSYAMIMEDLTYNPAERVPIPKKNTGIGKTDVYIDADELTVFFNEIKGHPLEEFFMITLFFGLRRSETLGIRWSSIDFERNTLTIEHTVVRTCKARIEQDSTKTSASFRVFPLEDFTKSIFLVIKERQAEYRKIFGSDYQHTDYVFTWADGRPFLPDYITKTFRKIVKNSPNLSSDLRLHDLRVSNVSLLIEAGYSVKEVQKWIGHADAKTTLNIYAKVKESKKKVIANDLGDKFKKAIADQQ